MVAGKDFKILIIEETAYPDAIAAAWAGVHANDLYKEAGWSQRLEVRKDGITLYAFVILVRNQEKDTHNISFLYNQIKSFNKNHGPVIILGAALEDEKEKYFPAIKKIAATLKIGYEFINEKKLKVFDKAETAKVGSMFNSMRAAANPAPQPDVAVKPLKNEALNEKQLTTWERLMKYVKTEVFKSSQTVAA